MYLTFIFQKSVFIDHRSTIYYFHENKSSKKIWAMRRPEAIKKQPKNRFFSCFLAIIDQTVFFSKKKISCPYFLRIKTSIAESPLNRCRTGKKSSPQDCVSPRGHFAPRLFLLSSSFSEINSSAKFAWPLSDTKSCIG